MPATIALEILNLIGAGDFVTNLIAGFVNLLIQIAGMWLFMAGAILNVSITLTMHIKDFVNATPGVYLVWQTIRDISGMGIIFLLLFASFKIILGIDNKVGDLIKNVIIAGILINFSFFLTALMIDASNVVSLAIYKSIAPGEEKLLDICPSGRKGINCITEQTYTDGGISAIFQNSLKVQNVFDPNHADVKKSAGDNEKTQTKIILFGSAAVVMMFTTGLSFIVAAGAFIVRLVILVGLLAMSPLMFLSMIFPEAGSYSKKWFDMLKSQLIFMPVYLLLLYVALLIMTSSSLLGNVTGTAIINNTSGSSAPLEFVGLLVNYIIVIIALNLPLVAAISIGGSATSWINMKKIGAGALWEKIGRKTGGALGRNTVGKAASALNESSLARRFYANAPTLGLQVSKGLKSVGGASFGDTKGGYDKAVETKTKAQKALYDSIGKLDRSKFRTEAEFKAAQEKATEFKRAYASNVGKTVLNSLITSKKIPGFIQKAIGPDEASRKSAFDLDIDANAKKYPKDREALTQKIQNYKDAFDSEARGKLDEQISTLNTKIVLANAEEAEKLKAEKEILEKRKTEVSNVIRMAEEKGEENVRKMIKELEDEEVELKSKVDRIEKATKDKETKDLIKKLKGEIDKLDEGSKPKKEESGEGGKSGESGGEKSKS